MTEPDNRMHILFVDDEQHVLDGLRRMLRGQRQQWDPAFVSSGPAALQHLERNPCHVVVSDMRMPGMDGSALLARIAQLYPGVVRIVLSGYSDQETTLRALGSAHQFLSKPCDAQTLCQAIDRALALRNLLGDTNLRDLVSNLGKLPTMPSIYRQIQQQLASNSCSLERIGELIQQDPAMTAKILQMVNSSFFGLSRRVSSPVQATTLLGMEVVRAVLLSLHVLGEASSESLKLPSISGLWRHSLAAAATAKKIMSLEKQPQRDIDDTFTAGMLHDTGKLLLAVHLTDRYRRVLERSAAEHLPLMYAELEEFGATHAQVGGYLLGIWGLPDAIVEAVTYHHDPSHCAVHQFGPLAAVHVADGFGHDHQSGADLIPPAPIDQAYLQELGIIDRLSLWRQQARQSLSGAVL